MFCLYNGPMRLLLTILLLGLPVVGEAQTIRLSIIYLPGEGGFVDAESKRREDSSRDLLRQFERFPLTRLDDPQSGNLYLQVVESAVESGPPRSELRERPPILGGGQRLDTVRTEEYVVRARLRLKDYIKEFEGRSVGDIPTWTDAARRLADQVKTWIRDNHQQVCREYPGSCG